MVHPFYVFAAGCLSGIMLEAAVCCIVHGALFDGRYMTAFTCYLLVKQSEHALDVCAAK
jgi:hypothetical protein